MLRKKVVAVNGFYQKYCTFATDTAKDATGTTLTPTIYHNALKNSFADQDMYGWKQTNESPTNGLDMMVDADSDGNKFWRSSLKNTMTQTVSLSGNKGSSYPIWARLVLRMAGRPCLRWARSMPRPPSCSSLSRPRPKIPIRSTATKTPCSTTSVCCCPRMKRPSRMRTC